MSSERAAEIISADSWPVIPNEGVFRPREKKVKKLCHKIKLWLNLIDRCAVTVLVIYKRVGKTAEYTDLQDKCILPSCQHPIFSADWIHLWITICPVPRKVLVPVRMLPNTWLNLSGNVTRTSSEDFKLRSYIQMRRVCTGYAVKVRTVLVRTI